MFAHYRGEKLSRLRRRLRRGLHEGNRLTVIYASHDLARRTPLRFPVQRAFYAMVERWARSDFDMANRVARIQTELDAAKMRLDVIVAEIARWREEGGEAGMWNAFALTDTETQARQDLQPIMSAMAEARRVY